MSHAARRHKRSGDVLLVGSDTADIAEIRKCLSSGDKAAIRTYWATKLATALAGLRAREFEAILLDPFLAECRGLQTPEAIRAAAFGAPIIAIADPPGEGGVPALDERARDLLVRGHPEGGPLSRILDELIERKLAADALFAEKERAELTLDSIGDAVLCTDTLGKVTYLNPIAERLTGWSSGEAAGRSAADVFRVIDGNTREAIHDPLQQAIRLDKRMALPASSILVRKDGLESGIEDSIAPIHDRDGTVAGAVVVFHDVSEARALAVKMSHLAQHDFLTDLPNRVLFNDRLTQAIAMARRHKRQLAVLFLDCDKFKEINDSLGHTVGDLLLQSVARRLVASGRSSDTVSRLGGDEFIILLSELERTEDAALCAAKIIKAMVAPHSIGRHELSLTASVGVAVYPADGRNAEGLVRCADMALYEAKNGGRNNYRLFHPAMRARAMERESVEGSLARALEREEFRLHYQPRFNLATGAIAGVEALVRWEHPERGLVGPAEFVPIAEQSGLIVPIGRWVLREACLQAVHWREAGLDVGPMAINVSAAEFRSADYLEGVARLLAESLHDPRLLELELSENVIMQDAVAIGTSLRRLAGTGVRLALDDFGTGFSSLSHLKRFPISTLKIDRSFVREIANDPDDRSVVQAIIDLGRRFGQTVIAEGVETPEQLEVLRDFNCQEGQGFHFCRPLPADEFADYAADH